MAGSKSDYLEKKLLDHVLGGPDFERPATVYVALYTVAPSDSGGGVEVSGADYQRVAVTNNGVNWPAATGTTATKKNGTVIDFGVAGGGGWGTVVAAGLFDADAPGGNLLYWGDLLVPKAVASGDPVRFPINAITITED